MPRIVEYKLALEKLGAQGLVCNYFNGGAFGFAKGVDAGILGWTSGEDPTIRPELRAAVRPFGPPGEEKLAQAAASVWMKELPGRAWIMPLSHWAFELDFGSKSWLPTLISSTAVDPQLLAGRADASPIEFTDADRPALAAFVQTLLAKLSASDFMLAFPGHPALCTIHHHKQLWWTSPDRELLQRIDRHGADSAL